MDLTSLKIELEGKIIDLLKESENGLSNDTIRKETSGYDDKLRGDIVNKLLSENAIEILKIPGATGTFVLRLTKGCIPDNSTPEEKLVIFLHT